MQIAKILGLALAAFLAPQAGSAVPPTDTPQMGAPPAGIKIVAQGDGVIFEDAKGVALYTFDGDAGKPGKSACNQRCAQQWPPLQAPADAKPQGPWSIIVREDGSPQWAVNGRPLYYFAQEGGPGTTFGDGEGNNTWHTAFAPIWTPPGLTMNKTVRGTVLADATHMTLYVRDAKSPCTGPCLDKFVPVIAPELAIASGAWSVMERDDGSGQWAYNSKPLYRSLLDVSPSETGGDGVDVGGRWRAAVLEAAPPLPSWVTLQQSLGGEVLADAHGFTLYYHGGPRVQLTAAAEAAAGQKCAGATCMGREWKAVLADAGATPVGNWTLIANAQDGTLQWAFKGRRLYINTLETMAGEIKGFRFGGDRAWRVMTRTGQCPDLC